MEQYKWQQKVQGKKKETGNVKNRFSWDKQLHQTVSLEEPADNLTLYNIL